MDMFAMAHFACFYQRVFPRIVCIVPEATSKKIGVVVFVSPEKFVPVAL